MRATDAWPPPWEAIDTPGALWWLVRLLAYRDLKYAIEHERPIDEMTTDWPASEGWV